MVERLRTMIQPAATVAVLGLAYKPYSHVIEESQGVYLARALSKAGARVVAYAPLAGEMAQAELRDQAVMLDSVADCLEQAEVVVITTPDPAFQTLSAAEFDNKKSVVTGMDFWRILDKELAGPPGIRYIPIGRSIDDQANAARLVELWNSVAWEIARGVLAIGAGSNQHYRFFYRKISVVR